MGCVSQDSHPRKSIPREEGKLGSNHTVKLPKGTWHQGKKIGKERVHREELSEPLERSPCAPKFGEISHEETLHQERCAHKQRGIRRTYLQVQKCGQSCVFYSIEARRMPAFTSKIPEEREFVVDSRASTHMPSKKVLSSNELDTSGTSTNSTVVGTTNGKVQTNEEAQVFVHDLKFFVTVQLHEESPAVLSQGKLCEKHGFSYEWVSGQKPRSTKDGKSIICKTDNFVPLVVPGLSTNLERVSSSASLSQDFKEAEVASRRLVQSLEIPNQIKTRDDKRNSKDLLADLPEWLEEFTDNLEDTEVPAPAHSSHDSDSERATKVVLRKHSV